MKLPTLLVITGGLLLAATSAVRAQPAPAAPAPAAPANANAENELKAIAAKLQTKYATGTKNADDYAPELKLLDDFVAAHKGDADVSAEAMFVKAAFKLRVLDDTQAGAAILSQIIETYPNTVVAQQQAKPMLDIVKQHIQGEKVAAAMKPGIEFPDFNEQDLNGAPVSLAKYKGKVVLIDFWATWCGPCTAELPNVLAAYKKYHDKGFEIIGISLDDDLGTVQGFVAAKGMDWQHFYDGGGWNNKLAKRYGVTAIPATYLIGPDGKIVAKDLRGAALEEELAKLLK